MIRKIKIRRFKSVREVDLEFGKVNIFIGGNGSGKSNLLEAIGVISAALKNGVADSDFSEKGVRITPPALMKSAFKNADLPKSLSLTAEVEGGATYQCSLQASDVETSLSFSHERAESEGKKIFGRGPNGSNVLGHSLKRGPSKNKGIWSFAKALFDFDEIIADQLDALSRYAIYSPQPEFLRGSKVGSVDSPPIGLHGEGLAVALNTLTRDWSKVTAPRTNASPEEQQLVKSCISLVFSPGWAKAVRVGRISPLMLSRDTPTSEDTVYFLDKYMHARRNTLSAYDSSEGSLFLLFSAILLSHREAPRIFALDNVDSALNPRLTKHLVSTIIQSTRLKEKSDFARGPNQVFLTSHNPTALDAFDIFDDDTRIFIVQRGDSGDTIATRLEPISGLSRSDFQLAMKGRNLSQLWIDGELAGALGSGV